MVAQSGARLKASDPVASVRVAALLETGSSAASTAADIGLTAEHVRLWCEITGTGAHAAVANGTVAQNRAGILSLGRLRELYEHQDVPMTEIGAMAGCATSEHTAPCRAPHLSGHSAGSIDGGPAAS